MSLAGNKEAVYQHRGRDVNLEIKFFTTGNTEFTEKVKRGDVLNASRASTALNVKTALVSTMALFHHDSR